MHILIPFDIVPVSGRVPFGVAPVSERAVRYALEVFGAHDDARITAVHLGADASDLPNEIAASEIESIASEEDLSIETAIHELEGRDSMDAIRNGILDIVENEDVDAVVMGYEEKSFVDELFHESTANRVLSEYAIPVVLVP
jgi:nucleotide-binding universal stress UspA family protein